MSGGVLWSAVLAAAVAAVVAVPVGVAAETRPTLDDCDILGTEGDDVLIGTSEPEIICGLGGDDTIIGNGGEESWPVPPLHRRDYLLGGPGDDTIEWRIVERVGRR